MCLGPPEDLRRGPWRNAGTAGWNCSEKGEMTLFCLEDTVTLNKNLVGGKYHAKKKTQSVLLVMYNSKYILFAGKKTGIASTSAEGVCACVCMCVFQFFCGKQLVNGGFELPKWWLVWIA